MRYSNFKIFIWLFCILALRCSTALAASPWFTGPILAPDGVTLEMGQYESRNYFFNTVNNGVYNRHVHLVADQGSESLITVPIFRYALFRGMEVELGVPYVLNKSGIQIYHRLGDVSIAFGHQVFRQQTNIPWIPSLRLVVQEIFPTGRFQELNPTNIGGDATGVGSYQTSIQLNFQWLNQIFKDHYLQTRLSLNQIVASSIAVNGFNTFGGSPDTFGVIHPGGLSSIDLAAEFTVTRHWVAVMEAYVAQRAKATFKGQAGTDPIRQAPAIIGHSTINEVTLAPAIEYNFSEHFGILGGIWFTIGGSQVSNFRSITVNLNIKM